MSDNPADDMIRKVRARAYRDPAWFCRTVLNVSPDVWQIEILEAILDVHRHFKGRPTVINHEGKQKITCRAMHGPGKTFTAALAIHLFNFLWPGRIPCTAPKEAQLRTRLWPEIRGIRNRAAPWYRALVEITATKVIWGGDEDRCALGETAADPTNLAGHHRDYMLFVIEEASGVKEAFFPVIEGAISTGLVGVILMIGNPTTNVGTFYMSHCVDRVAQDYFRMHVSLDKTTRVSRKWVESMVRKYGQDSPVVQIRCFGNFAQAYENQLIVLQWILESADRAAKFDGDGSIPKIRVSVDVADGGEDESVITVGLHYQSGVYIKYQSAHRFPPAESPILVAQEAERIFHRFGGDRTVDDFVVDSVGVGAGTAGWLIKKGYMVVRYMGGSASADPKRWRNRRTQSYVSLRDHFRDGFIFVDPSILEEDWDDFTAQLCSVKTKDTGDRVDDLVTKGEMKTDGLKSPDRADSIAMQFATQAPQIEGAGANNNIGQVQTVGTLETSNADW